MAGGYWPLPINENGDLTLPPSDQKTKAKRDSQSANLATNYLERLADSRKQTVKTRGIPGLIGRYVLGRVDDGEIGYDPIADARATNAALDAKGVHVLSTRCRHRSSHPTSGWRPGLSEASDGQLLGDPSRLRAAAAT